MSNIIKAVRNQSVKRLVTAVEATAKAEARAELLGEIAARATHEQNLGIFNPDHFIHDLVASRQTEEKGVTASQSDVLTALGSMEIDDLMAATNIINPALVSQALEIDYIVKPMIDDSGKLTVAVESKDGRYGGTIQETIERMKISPKTSFLFDEKPTGEASQRTNNLKNPWKKETFNLTAQGRIVTENPEMAAKLKAEAIGASR